ncbi:GntR family transcriptional regulator [Panacagrimonas sp.]|uniref:GntR family transcriptional regulator n=1 Tax=Panacagrimonas sp. TaxID=2480088 RepID=UPI003B530383
MNVLSNSPRVRTAEEVYHQLKTLIMSFELYPGTRVTETELATRFGVSRTPVREALQRLQLEGYLTVRPKQGCFIREIDIEEIDEHYQVRIALEMCAVEMACTHMPDRALKDLARLWDPAYQPTEDIDVETMAARDEGFHIALAEGSGNLVLADYLQRVNHSIHVIRRLDFTNDMRVDLTYKEHHAICQHLIRRDVVAAQQALTQHIRRSQLAAKTITLEQLSRARSRVRRALRER